MVVVYVLWRCIKAVNGVNSVNYNGVAIFACNLAKVWKLGNARWTPSAPEVDYCYLTATGCNRVDKLARKTVLTVYNVAHLAGFDIVGDITLKDHITGKIYK